MTVTHFFFFAEVVFVQGIGQLNVTDTSKLDESLPSLLVSSTCRASYLLFLLRVKKHLN